MPQLAALRFFWTFRIHFFGAWRKAGSDGKHEERLKSQKTFHVTSPKHFLPNGKFGKSSTHP